MRLRRSIAALALALFANAGLAAGQASAAEPVAPCPPGTPAAMEIVSAPFTVAFEREFSAELEEVNWFEPLTAASVWRANEIPHQGTFELSPGLSGIAPQSGFSDTFDQSPRKLGVLSSPSLRISKAEGTARLTASWVQRKGYKYGVPSSYEECTGSAQISVQGVRGRLSRARADISGLGSRFEFFRLYASCPAREEEGFGRPNISAAPIRISLRGDGEARSATLSDACDGKMPRVQTPEWRLSHEVTLHGTNFVLRPLHAFSQPQTKFRFAVWQASKKLISGSFHIWTLQTPFRMIEEGSDAFVNYCIDNDKELRSLAGHLYCVAESSAFEEVTHLKWRRG